MSIKERIKEIHTILEDAHTDDKDRYLMTLGNDNGEFAQIVGREEYLEFMMEAAMNDLANLLGEMEAGEVS